MLRMDPRCTEGFGETRRTWCRLAIRWVPVRYNVSASEAYFLCKREVVEVTLTPPFDALSVAERDVWSMRLAEIVSSDASASDLNHSYSRFVSQTCTCLDRLLTALSPRLSFITRSAPWIVTVLLPRMRN